MSEFGDRLRTARKARGWTQNQLAAAAGVTGSAVCHWESGRSSQPMPYNLVPLASALGITPGCLEGVEWDLASLAEELGHPCVPHNEALFLLPPLPVPPAIPLRGRIRKHPARKLTEGQRLMCAQFRNARINQKRMQRDVSIEVFGKVGGHLSSIENCKLVPGPKLARRLCAVLGLNFNLVYCPPGGDE